MAKNQVQYQKGYSLIELFNNGTEAQCISLCSIGSGHRAFTALNVVQPVIAR